MFVLKNLFVDIADDFHLQIPELQFPESGVLVLTGPSGCGKTTFLKALCGFESVKQGLVWMFNDNGQMLDLAKLTVADRKLGVVFQGSDLFPHMTAEENLTFAARCRDLSILQTRTDIAELSAALDIESCLPKKVFQLSGGERQRVALARSIIGAPRLLLLDEPFASLDQENRERARDLLAHVIRKRALPLLLITHDASDAAYFKAPLVRMENGRIVS